MRAICDDNRDLYGYRRICLSLLNECFILVLP
ncbi:MAG: hypothetical protein ACOYEA_06060 [Fermentimonas sp.]